MWNRPFLGSDYKNWVEYYIRKYAIFTRIFRNLHDWKVKQETSEAALTSCILLSDILITQELLHEFFSVTSKLLFKVLK